MNERLKRALENQMDTAQDARKQHATIAQAPLSCIVLNTPVVLQKGMPPLLIPRFHVFSCPPAEARTKARSEAVSFRDRPEGFEYLDEAEDWAGGKAVERKQFFFGG